MDGQHETQAALLEAIDGATLTPPVQSALGSRTADVVDWEFEKLCVGGAQETQLRSISN